VSRSPSRPAASRRAFLRQAAGVALIGAGGAAADPLAPPVAHPAEPAYRPVFFTPAEWTFLNAACDRLVPSDDLSPGGAALGVPQYIDQQMGTSWADGGLWYMQGPFLEAKPEFGYQSALTPKQQYRIAIRAIDAACQAAQGKVFAALPPEQQDEVLKKIESGVLTSAEISLKGFFTGFLLKNTMEGVFCDPLYGGNRDMAGWKMIGHPGARGDYTDWVSADQPYPYGPVSLHGQRD
jgi:gluconate 2-dehydrogenase gamma chain